METFCPHCENHCPKNALRCNRGREHFGAGEGPAVHAAPEERVLVLLRKCGHFLHHSAASPEGASHLMDVLTPEEKETLAALLEKCLARWENQGK